MSPIQDQSVSPVSVDDEPLYMIERPFLNVVEGSEGNEFHSQNASLTDFERRSIIERTGGNIHARVELMDVVHGTYDEDGDEATLMVFRFRFDPQKNSRRILHATVKVEFFASNYDGELPVVDAIAPEEKWLVGLTTDQEVTTRGGELNMGVPSGPFLQAGGTVKLNKTTTRNMDDATTISGAINYGTGRNSGEPTVAIWNLKENKRRQTGVPDSAKVAVLIRRQDSAPFNAVVTLDADMDFLSGLERLIARIPLDDPILFNPTMTGKKPKKGREYGAENLSNVDLYALCELRMAVVAPFLTGGGGVS